MSKADGLQRVYEANIACGDISDVAEARMLSEIAAAEADKRQGHRMALSEQISLSRGVTFRSLQ